MLLALPKSLGRLLDLAASLSRCCFDAPPSTRSLPLLRARNLLFGRALLVLLLFVVSLKGALETLRVEDADLGLVE